MTTKLMEKAIAYLRRLEPIAQDQLASNILEDSLADLSEVESQAIAARLAEADADFQAGRYSEDGNVFWAARLAHAKGVKPA